MVIYDEAALMDCARRNAQARGSEEMFLRYARAAEWRPPGDMLQLFPQASVLPGSRVMLRLGRNKHRLVAPIDHERQVLLVRFMGTHAQYDKIDAETM